MIEVVESCSPLERRSLVFVGVVVVVARCGTCMLATVRIECRGGRVEMMWVIQGWTSSPSQGRRVCIVVSSRDRQVSPGHRRGRSLESSPWLIVVVLCCIVLESSLSRCEEESSSR